jgi:hypothetical protein
MAEELTRKQLQEQNEALMARLAALEAAAKPANDAAQAVKDKQLADALAELAALKRPQVSGQVTGAPPRLIPYKGFVQAIENCWYGGLVQYCASDTSAHNPNPGAVSVFEVDVPALWSDDPYVPVNVSYDKAGARIVELRRDVHQIDFRFRIQAAGQVDIPPLRASAY